MTETDVVLIGAGADGNPSVPVALNWTTDGTDVDFGSLSKKLVGYGVRTGTTTLFGHEVHGLSHESDGSWTVDVRNRRTGGTRRSRPASCSCVRGVALCTCCRRLA